MKNSLPKASQLYRVLEEIKYPKSLEIGLNELERDLIAARAQLKEVESMDEYHALTRRIKGLEEEVQEKQIQLKISIKTSELRLKEEREKIKDVYTEEFQPFYDKYLKLDKQLNKQLQKFAKESEAIVNEMVKIEQLETNFHLFRLQSPEFKDIMRLPVKTKGFGKPYTFYSTRGHSTADHTKNVINAIKKMEEVKK